MEDRLGGQRPAFQIVHLGDVPVSLDHDVLVLADALDLLDRGLQLEQPQIVQRAERDDEIEIVVAVGVGVLRLVGEEIGLHLFMRMGKAVLRDVKARDLQPRQYLLHFVQQKALAAADVEHARSILEAVGFDQRLGDRRPAALDESVAAIAEAAVAVPVIGFVFPRLQRTGDLVVVHASHVVPLGRRMQRGHHVQHPSHFQTSDLLQKISRRALRQPLIGRYVRACHAAASRMAGRPAILGRSERLTRHAAVRIDFEARGGVFRRKISASELASILVGRSINWRRPQACRPWRSLDPIGLM